MSNFRLGPNMFEQAPLDWFVCASDLAASNRSRLIGHGVTTRISWNGNPEELPRGWQGTVRWSYHNSVAEQRKCNTLVGLFVKIEDEYRGHQWAERVLQEMKNVRNESGLEALIIPLRLPKHYEKQYAGMSLDEFAHLRKEDGEYLDHWLRLHVKMGAEIIRLCGTSHQHAMNGDDFLQQFNSPGIVDSGYYLVERNGEWYRAFVDLDRDVALINQGCVWVRHSGPERSDSGQRQWSSGT